jgi:hypothetical protein
MLVLKGHKGVVQVGGQERWSNGGRPVSGKSWPLVMIVAPLANCVAHPTHHSDSRNPRHRRTVVSMACQ